MLLAVLVVQRGAACQQCGKRRRIHHRRIFRQRKDLLGHVEHIAAVAIGHRTQRGTRLGIERQSAADLGFGARQQLLQRRIVEPAQHQHLAARQQRAVQREGRVLGGGADQRDRAGLHNWQKTVLLGAVEAVDLIDEQQRPLPGPPPPRRLLECALEVGDAGEHRGQLHEMQPRAVGKQASDGGLAAAGRAPEDQRGQRAPLQHAGERAVGAEQMVLSHDIVERPRAQAIGQRARAGRRRRLGWRAEEIGRVGLFY